MLSFLHRGTVHCKSAPEGWTLKIFIWRFWGIHGMWYKECDPKSELWTIGSWFLHHNIVPAHTALPIRQFLAKHSISILP
jgi:hypothetical protein